jgi:23S rRNA (guanine745-N1)-methyltransferase
MILDAGCGEGSHLGKIISELHNKDITKVLGAGIDISKEGIIMASKTYHDIVWCVADLANLPFMDKQFDVIINILSPSNYREFTRVLKDDGILIKVIPGSSYLKELRDIFYNESGKQEYSNHNVLELYRQNFSILDVRAVKYNKIVGKDELSHIIAMTPLSWAITHEKKEQALITGISRITGDFAIIKGTKKGR